MGAGEIYPPGKIFSKRYALARDCAGSATLDFIIAFPSRHVSSVSHSSAMNQLSSFSSCFIFYFFTFLSPFSLSISFANFAFVFSIPYFLHRSYILVCVPFVLVENYASGIAEITSVRDSLL